MKTSVKKFNRQYRDGRLYIDGCINPKIINTCNEHKRCEVCPVHSHVRLYGWASLTNGWLEIYTCPTCGKSYAVFKEWPDEEEE